MFGISTSHLIIAGIILLLFGPKRLPELGQTLGKTIRKFKDSWEGIQNADFRHIDPPRQGNENTKTKENSKSKVEKNV